MKRTILSLVILIAAGISIFGQSKDEQAIRQTLTELMNALNRSDADTAERIYANDYQIVLQDGTTTTKAERLGAMKSGAVKYQSLVFDNLKIRQYGNAAVANYHVTGKGITPNGEQNVNSRATVTLVKNGNRWQVVSSQLTDSAANQSGSSSGNDEQAIRQYLGELDAMIVKDEAGALERFAADDLIFIGISGKKWTKAEQMENFKKATGTYTAFKRDIESIRVMGDMAVVVSHINFTSKNKQTGTTFNGGFRTTGVLAKRGGKWTAIVSQATRDEPQPDEKELNKFLDDYTAALQKNSADETDKFLANDYTRVGPDGSVATKEQQIAGIRSGDLKYQTVETTDRKWRFKGFGNVAIVTSKLTLKATNKGQDLSGTYRVTSVLNRAGVDRWVIASTHISPLAAGN
ncbi:MAG: nuclear transport factor 2 family protein [Acidobacteriota bacterium]|nr:nuclear transport factor 2 family protein [Acidobacteriota bacterium]